MVAGRNKNISPFTLDSKQLLSTNNGMTPTVRLYENSASCLAHEAHYDVVDDREEQGLYASETCGLWEGLLKLIFHLRE